VLGIAAPEVDSHAVTVPATEPKPASPGGASRPGGVVVEKASNVPLP